MRFQLLLGGVLCALSACSSPEPEPLAGDLLLRVRELADIGDYSEAEDLLEDYKRENFDRFSQGTYSLLAGDIYYNLDEWEESIKHYELFLRFEGSASEARLAEERLLEMGHELLKGDRLSLGLFTNRRRGEITLQNLAAWSPYSPLAAEALAYLGDYHFDNGDYVEAVEDYEQILRFHMASEWGDLASYRIGLCGFHQIGGPEIDGMLMKKSLDQLKRYLIDYPSGLYRNEANETIADLEELIAGHHLSIGDYYEVIDNIRGARYHYREAANYRDTESGIEAREELEDLPPDPPLEEPEFDD